MPMFNEVYKGSEEDVPDTDELTREASLKELLESKNKEEIIELEPAFVQVVGEKGMSKNFVKNLVKVYVASLIKNTIISSETAKLKTTELLEKINQVKPTTVFEQPINMIEKDGSYFIMKQTISGLSPKKVTNWIINEKKVIICSDGMQKTIFTINRNGSISTAEFDHTSMESVSRFESTLRQRDSEIYISASPHEFVEYFKPFFPSIKPIYYYSEDHMGLFFSEKTNEPIFLSPSINLASRESQSKVYTHSTETIDQNRLCISEPSKKVKYEHVSSDKERFKRLVQVMSETYPRINNKDKTITVLGWFVAGLLSGYLKDVKGNQFPLLYLTGNGQDGKSIMAEYCSLFIGHRTGSGLSMTSSPKPVRMALTSSNAHAAIFEEANAQDSKIVIKLIDMLKSAYDNHEVQVGKLNGSTDYKLVNPACIISNYNINDPALMTRCIKMEVFKAEWEGDRDSQDAYNEMEEIKGELNKESLELIQFLFLNHKQWDTWYSAAVKLTIPSDGSELVGRFAKSLKAVAFGLVIMQKLIESVGLDINEYFTTEAIQAHMKRLSHTMMEEKSKLDLEGQFLKFVARKHREQMNPSKYRYDVHNLNPVSIDRSHWIDLFMNYISRDFELKNIPRSAVDRATQAKKSKAIVDTHRPRIDGQKTTLHIIDVSIAEKEFGIEKFEWEQATHLLGLELHDEPKTFEVAD